MDTSAQALTSNIGTKSCLLMAIHILQREAEKGSNFVFSPLSFNSMLSLIAAGATGSTRKQLLSFLGSERVEELNSLAAQIFFSELLPANAAQDINRGPITSFVNGAWVDSRFGLKPSFEQVVKDVYHATAQKVDFANMADRVRDEVNSWVENATKGLIKNIIPPGSVDSQTTLILANALYFKGAWDRKFDSSKTKPQNFHLLNGQIIQAPFMISKKHEQYLYGSFDGYKVVKMPYQKGQDSRQFSMYFFLPNARNGLQNLLEKFKANPMKLINPSGLWKQPLSCLWIPRFKFSFEFEALNTMKELGIMGQVLYNLSELTDMVDSPQSLAVSNMFHKCFIEVNEDGTEAAASTIALLHWNCARPIELPSFVADHPFIFTIKEENSGTMLFVGAVLNPI